MKRRLQFCSGVSADDAGHTWGLWNMEIDIHCFQ